MLIDCDSCAVRNLACGDCVVTVLLGTPSLELDGAEQAALAVLAGQGLVPPLRLVPATATAAGAGGAGQVEGPQAGAAAPRAEAG